MKLGKWALAIAALALLFGSAADAQTIAANKLCIHNGSEYYVNGGFYGYPNHGSCRYFPSFTHFAATSKDNLGIVYPWKLAGWSWSGMQANVYGPTWYWENALQSSTDNPGATTMSFDYPALYCNGTVNVSGVPGPIYGGNIPSTVPTVGGYTWLFPSSMGGWDNYLNIFATGAASWTIPSTAPFYGWLFAFTWDCASAVTLPSSNSIWQFDWVMKGTYGQYVLMDGDCPDCLGGAGNKGRNYSLISDADNGYIWSWGNSGTGVQQEWAMCLFVCDAVTVPVNVPGGAGAGNPFLSYGFDVGAATITPLLSSNCVQLGFMTEDYTGLGGNRVALAAFAFWPTVGPYSLYNYRVPHGWDVLTNLFLGIAPLFMHSPTVGYPAAMFGTTIGAHSTLMPFPADPALMCSELRYSTYAMGKGQPMSASYMVTYF